MLFFVFAYQNQREWYEFNLLYGVIIAVASTLYGLVKLLVDSEVEVNRIGEDGVDSVIFFMVGIWIEVLLFGLVRRKKIRIPSLAGARTTVQRKVQSAYERLSRSLSLRHENIPLGDIDVSMGVQNDRLIGSDVWLEEEGEDSGELRGKGSTLLQKSGSNSLVSSPSLPNIPAEVNALSDFSKYELPLYPTSSFFNVRGINVHFRAERGTLPSHKGVAFLCLHGFAGGVFSFNQCWEKLKEICSIIIAFDRPGFGLTSRKIRPWDENPYTINFAVDICTELMNNLEVERVVLIAHGTGCLVGTYFCHQHQDLVERLVLLSPLFHTPKLIQSLFKTRLGKTVITQLVRTEMSALMLHRMWMYCENIPPFLEKWYQSILQLDNFDNAIWEMLQVEKPKEDVLRRDFAKLDLPILLLHGKSDKIVDISETETFVHKIRTLNPGGKMKFVPLPGVGHVTHEEFVELFIQELSLFLQI